MHCGLAGCVAMTTTGCAAKKNRRRFMHECALQPRLLPHTAASRLPDRRFGVTSRRRCSFSTAQRRNSSSAAACVNGSVAPLVGWQQGALDRVCRWYHVGRPHTNVTWRYMTPWPESAQRAKSALFRTPRYIHACFGRSRHHARARPEAAGTTSYPVRLHTALYTVISFFVLISRTQMVRVSKLFWRRRTLCARRTQLAWSMDHSATHIAHMLCSHSTFLVRENQVAADQ